MAICNWILQGDFEKFVKLNAVYVFVTFETKSLSNYFCFFLNKPIIPWNQIQNSWFHVNFVTKINDMQLKDFHIMIF